MVYSKTYNNVIDTLKNLGKEHNQITTTTTGDIWEVDLSKNTLFPLLHINPLNVQTGPSTLTYSFQIFVMDLVSERTNWTQANFQSANNLSNNQEVLSQTLQICTDIISMLRHSKWQNNPLDGNEPIIFGEGEFSIEPFSDRFDNEVTGWVFTLPITVQQTFNTCVVPVELNPILE
jgi:hypothetical protein